MPSVACHELPDGFSFMNAQYRAAGEELPEFQAVRLLFGVGDDFKDSTRRLLKMVGPGCKTSSGKSGSLMAFDENFVVKSMSKWEAWTLVSILRPYLAHLHLPQNRRGEAPATLLPRFMGAYVHTSSWSGRSYFVIMSNVFSGVPAEQLGRLELFDLKGSSDDRSQRGDNSELMDFDMLSQDRKLVPEDAGDGAELLEQLARDTDFLLAQHMPTDPTGFVEYGSIPESCRGRPGVMDYSLLIGLAPRGTPGGLRRLDVRDSRVRGDPLLQPERWRVEAEGRVALLGVIDVLQFWTPAKQIARQLKKAVGREHDLGGGYHGEMLDTLAPAPYRQRFLRFAGEALAHGSWLESLPRMCEGDWTQVPAAQIQWLPGVQRMEAGRRRRLADELNREQPDRACL